jgi:hypothetical protein
MILKTPSANKSQILQSTTWQTLKNSWTSIDFFKAITKEITKVEKNGSYSRKTVLMGRGATTAKTVWS